MRFLSSSPASPTIPVARRVLRLVTAVAGMFFLTAFPASLHAAGSCLDFNPWSDMVEVPADPDLNLTQMTVEVWVLLTEDLGLGSGYAILDKNLPPEPNTTPADSNYLMFIEGENDYRGYPSQHPRCVGWSIGTGTSYARVYSQTKAPDLEGEWHHIAGTYDGNTMSLYIDGVLENSIPTQLQPVHNNGLLTLGCSPVGFLFSWNGRLDEVRLWNRCRTPQEINRTMNVRMTGTEQGLVAYWNFDEGSGQVVHDLAGGDNNGQLGDIPEPDPIDGHDPEWSPLTAPCDVPLEIVSTSPLPDAKKGISYNFTFEAKGGYWNYAWSVASGSLPSGLSLSGDGVLSGTPGEYGNFSFAVEVTDGGSPPATDSAVFDLHVRPPDLVITTTTLPAGVEAQAYSQTLQAQGGIAPYRWTVVSSGLPDGLSLNPNTGVLSGTPTNAAIGDWLFNVQAEDSQSPAYTDTQVFSLTIVPAADLTITTASPLPSGKMGVAYSTTFAASGGKLPHSWEVASGDLPNGLTIAASGVLSGTPEEYGQFQFTVQVSDSQDPADTATKMFSLTIFPADVVIETASLPPGVEGIPYTQTLQATGGATPYSWQVVGGVLPPGLALNGSSGTISGTPTNAAIETWNFIVRVSDSQSPADTDDHGYSVTVTAGAPVTITSSPTLPDGKVGDAYSFAFTATGGKLPHFYEFESGSLPPGLTVSSNGTLSGTPTASGDYTFVVRAEDSQQTPDSDSQEFTVRIIPPNVTVQTATLPDGTEGATYSASLTAADGIEPYSWRVTSGALPDGLTLSVSGVISGRPSNAAIGTSYFTVEVTDSYSPPSSDSRALSLTIHASKRVSVVTYPPLPDGKVGESYGFIFTATGGKSPYTWDLASGTLPEGLNLASDGRLSGVPTQSGDFSFDIRATDSQQTPDSATKAMAIRILPADLVITTNSLADGAEGSAYSQSLTATGGLLPYAWQLTAGSLPDGLSLGANGVISGIPRNVAIGTASFTVRVSDSQSQPATDERALTITVHPSGSLAITTASSLPDGKVGQIYTVSLAASGGKLPYMWSLDAGSLPSGLTLTPEGIISGTPTLQGDSQFTLRVTDSQNPPASVTQSFFIHIVPADLTITTLSLAAGTEGVLYQQALQATGGIPPLTWAITTGTLPEGLSLDAATGIISGSPTNAAIGRWSPTVTVSDSQTPAGRDERMFRLVIAPAGPLAISTASPLPDGKLGVPYSVTFTATGGKIPYTWQVIDGLLPAGLTFTGAGNLNGTPTEHGDFAFTIGVVDSQPEIASRSFSLRVSPADLVLLTPAFPDGVEGTPYIQILEATGGVTPYTLRVLSGSLPDGLALNQSTGTVSGTPTNAAIGVSTFVIRLEDSQAPPAVSDRQFSIAIGPASELAIATQSPIPDGKVGEAYNQTFSASGGKTPYSWTVASGQLPQGLALSADGTLSGTPIEHGSFTFNVRVEDSREPPVAAVKLFALTIAPTDLKIITSSLPNGQEGVAYSEDLEAAGGVVPYTWTIVAGSLPDGLTLDSATGRVSGAPTNGAIGEWVLTAQVRDSQTSPAQDQREFRLIVEPAQSVSIQTATPLPAGRVNEAYNLAFVATGGKRPYTWSLVSGTFPSGLLLSTDGTLSGTPLQQGDYAFEIEVSDSQSPTDAVRAGFSVYVSPADLAIATTSLTGGREGTLYRQVLAAKGGASPYAWSLVQGALPDGLELEGTTGVISGTPTNPAIGTCTFTVRVADSQSPADTAERELSITILPKSPLQIMTGSPLPDGRVDEPYTLIFSASGGKLPYSWSVASGTLPPGLIIGSSGQLNGAPTEPGDFSFTIRVTDSQQPRVSAEEQFSVSIARREITLEVNPTNLTFSTRRGGSNPPSQPLTIRVQGIARVTWQALEDCGWLTVDPTSGTNTGEEDVVTVSVNKTGLDVGTYRAAIDVVPLEAPEKHALVEATLRINPIRVPEDYPTIQEGLNAAKPSDMVLAAPGLYRERVVVEEGVCLAGSGAEQTTIDGMGQGTVVALLGNGSSLEGFTVRNGVGDYFGNGSRVGGGVYSGAASATISRCTIVGNTAVQGWGGGVFVKSGCSLLIVEAEISGNSAESGGGIFCHENSWLRVERSRFCENVVKGFGGGICCIDLSLATVTGCEFSQNSAGYSGGAIAGNDRSELTVVNCTLADNLADEGGGIFGEYASSVSLVNSLLWNTFSDLALLGTASVRYCDIRDGGFLGENHNFSTDPRFVNPVGRDYHLLPNSPCLDIGEGTSDDLTETDLDGEPRVLQGYNRLVPDIGADEMNPETVFALIPSPPVALPLQGLVTVNYTLWNAQAKISSIAADYSTDGGESWYRAARAQSSEGTEGLSTSADGKAHSFVWDSVADLGGKTAEGLRMRIRPTAFKAHYPATSEAFALDNSLADSDDDKLPDLWETQIVDADAGDLILAVADVLPNDDFDGDGQTNGFEYLTGTSPVNEESLFGVQLTMRPDGGVNLSWSSVKGKTYTIEYCEELCGEWVLLGSAQAGTGGILQTSDESPPGRKRFYRLGAY